MNRIVKAGIPFFALAVAASAFAQNAETADPTCAQRLTPAQVEEKIRGYMDECKTVGMAAVMVKGDKIVYQKAFGYRDKDTREPLDINDIFRIASISKSFSGISILQLVEAGKMSLEDDVNDILGMKIRNPRYPDIPVTVKMLLSHTSSMTDGGGVDMYRDLTYVDESKTDIKTIREKAWLPYPPGKGYKYCNRGLNIIGLIIEKVSGERFDEYVLNHILKPIGVDNAGYNLDALDSSTFTTLYVYNKKSDKLVPGKGYVRNNEIKVANGTYQIGKDGCYWSPTGGMKMSAPNLAKWMMTLRNGGVAMLGCLGNHEHHRGKVGRAVKAGTSPLAATVPDMLKDVYPFPNDFTATVVNGVNFVMIDDSANTVSADQASRFEAEAKKNLPIILCMHCPFPTREIVRAGSRFWRSKGNLRTIRNMDGYVEKYKDGTTQDFVAYLRAQPLLKGILCGHGHIGVVSPFSPTAKQYEVAGNFMFHAQEFMVS